MNVIEASKLNDLRPILSQLHPEKEMAISAAMPILETQTSVLPGVAEPMTRIASLTIVLTSLLCGSAFAHNTVPADWCPSGTRVEIVSEFSFTPSQLQTYRGIQDERSGGEGSCTNAGLRTCGIVDDWFTAYSLTAGVCKGTALRLDAPEKTAAFVLSPASFNAREHHDLYQFNDGVLRGVCVTCVANVRPPVIELPIKPVGPSSP